MTSFNIIMTIFILKCRRERIDNSYFFTTGYCVLKDFTATVYLFNNIFDIERPQLYLCWKLLTRDFFTLGWLSLRDFICCCLRVYYVLYLLKLYTLNYDLRYFKLFSLTYGTFQMVCDCLLDKVQTMPWKISQNRNKTSLPVLLRG